MDYKRCRILIVRSCTTEALRAALSGVPDGTAIREMEIEVGDGGRLRLKLTNQAWPVVGQGEQIPYHCENGEAC